MSLDALHNVTQVTQAVRQHLEDCKKNGSKPQVDNSFYKRSELTNEQTQKDQQKQMKQFMDQQHRYNEIQQTYDIYAILAKLNHKLDKLEQQIESITNSSSSSSSSSGGSSYNFNNIAKRLKRVECYCEFLVDAHPKCDTYSLNHRLQDIDNE
jgi:chromosome segregation ATPase